MRLSFAAGLVLTLLLAPAAAADTKAVAIRGSQFAPNVIQVFPGDLVVWTNEDSIPHSVVSDNASFEPSPALDQGGQFLHEFPHGGRYTYHCGVHPAMAGAIFVFAGAQDPPPTFRSPAENATVAGVVLVTGTAPRPTGASTGNATPASVDVRVDEAAWAPANVTADASGTLAWEYEWDTRDVADGAHLVVARLTLGERVSTSSRTLRVANGVTLVTPTPGGPLDARFTLSELTATPQAGLAYYVHVTVTNVGDANATALVQLVRDGQGAERRVSFLAPGASEELTWVVAFATSPAATTVFAEVVGGARTSERALTVDAPPPADPGEDGTPLGPTVGIAALAVAAITARARRR